jgi:transcription elongation GreA/GreB family factor
MGSVENADYHKAKEDQGFLEAGSRSWVSLKNVVIIEENNQIETHG